MNVLNYKKTYIECVHEDSKTYIIIGGGLMGILTSYYLSFYPQNKIIVLEKEDEVSKGASFANAGLLCPTLSYSIVHPRLYGMFGLSYLKGKIGNNQWFEMDFLKWTFYYTKQVCFSNYEKKTRIHHSLCLYSLKCLQNILEEEDLKEDILEKTTLLTTFSTKTALQWAKQNITYFSNKYTPTIYPYTEYNEEQTKELTSPYLSLPSNVMCSLQSPIDKVGDARKFSIAMKKVCIARGVKFVHNSEVIGFERKDNIVTKVLTTTDKISGDTFILCCGVYTPLLTKLLGIYTPIIPMKGYSITYHYNNNKRPNMPYTIQDNKHSIGIIPFENSIRIAGVADFLGYNFDFSEKRATYLHSIFHKYFPKKTYSHFSQWTGLRPLTPDSLPIIGQLKPFSNVYINAGHGMFGWTMAAGSCKILTDSIMKTLRSSKLPIHLFSPNRF